MFKILLVSSIFMVMNLFCATLAPIHKIEASGNILDMTKAGDKIFVGLDNGKVEIYNQSDKKLIGEIRLENISSFFEESFPPKVFSVDELDGAVLIVSESEDGARDVYIKEQSGLKKIISKKDKLTIKTAKFIDKNRVVFGQMSNELLFFDLNKNSIYQKIQLSTSTFSHFVLNEEKNMIASTCESGIIYIYDIYKNKVITQLKGANKDNIYKLDFKSNKVIAAGQDRIASIYSLDSKEFKTHSAQFLIYAAALSPSGKIGAFVKNEKNDIEVFDVESGVILGLLSGHKSTLNTIIFTDENNIISSSDDKNILFWKIGEKK